VGAAAKLIKRKRDQRYDDDGQSQAHALIDHHEVPPLLEVPASTQTLFSPGAQAVAACRRCEPVGLKPGRLTTRLGRYQGKMPYEALRSCGIEEPHRSQEARRQVFMPSMTSDCGIAVDTALLRKSCGKKLFQRKVLTRRFGRYIAAHD
jgi:hypothetical protein